MTSFWSFFIIVLFTSCNLLLIWLLFGNRTTTSAENENTTGHVYDGIEEYDNPLPGWFFNLFIATFIFAAIYLVLYPGFGSFKGILGWTQAGALQQDIADAEEEFKEKVAPFMAMPAADLASSREALKMGQRLFKNNCSTCHGVDAKGAYAFPNLTDNDWLYGGSEENIKQTITHGRKGAMPPWGAVLGDKLDSMADYVKRLGQEDVSQHAMHETFVSMCSACHLKDGTGNQALGGPNLTDDIWLYGGSLSEIRLTIEKGRNGNMPDFKDTLSKERIHLVTGYILSLSAKSNN